MIQGAQYEGATVWFNTMLASAGAACRAGERQRAAKTPDYQVLSIDISHLVSPPTSINPASTAKSMAGEVSNALQQKGFEVPVSRLAAGSPVARKGRGR